MLQGCDLLVCSTDGFLAEAKVTIGQLTSLGIAEDFRIFLSLGDLRPDLEGVTILNRRKPGTWSSELLEALDQLTGEYVLLWLDDFVPLDVRRREVTSLLSWAMGNGVDYLRLNPTPQGEGPMTPEHVRRIPEGAIYRTSTIYSVWRRAVLMDLLRPEESAWQFELNGSARSDDYAAFFASAVELVPCVNLVVKGLVDPRAERRLLERGIPLDQVLRPRMTRRQVAALRMRELRTRTMNLLPWRVRRWVRNLANTDLRAATT